MGHIVIIFIGDSNIFAGGVSRQIEMSGFKKKNIYKALGNMSIIKYLW
jgi:hypothetical protein